MRLISIFLVVGFPLLSSATDLTCRATVNLEPVLQVAVSSQMGVKTVVGQVRGSAIYITEKENGIFELEAFVPEYEIRLYSAGLLVPNKGPLSQTLWGRDSLTEISCAIDPVK